MHSFTQLFEEVRASHVIELAEEILKARGGWLFDGYKAVAPQEWRIAAELPTK